MKAAAQAKANLARAYAAGEQPKHMSTAPNGRDELWMLAGVGFIVPSIPPDAPATLEYALRLHRGALFTGTCENCSATISLSDAGDLDGVNFAQSMIAHKRACPGNNSTILDQLQEHWAAKASQTDEEAHKAASATTKESVLRSIGDRGVEIVNSEYTDWATGVLDERLDGPGSVWCDHLRADPHQTWNLLLGEPTWRCNECWAYLSHRIASGQWRLPPIDDHSCDHCSRFAPNTLEPLVLRIGTFVLRGGLCRRCSRESQQESVAAAEARGD